MKVRLKPLHHLVADHPKDHRIVLEPGVTILGRGEDTKCKVALCSRKQVRIEVEDHQATITGLTKRPCIVRREDGTTIQLAKGDTPVPLRHHDTLTLLAGCELDASFNVEVVRLRTDSQSTLEEEDDEFIQGQELNGSETGPNESGIDPAPSSLNVQRHVCDSDSQTNSNILFAADKPISKSAASLPHASQGVPDIQVSSYQKSQTDGRVADVDVHHHHPDDMDSALLLFDEDDDERSNHDGDHGTGGSPNKSMNELDSVSHSKRSSIASSQKASQGNEASRQGTAPSTAGKDTGNSKIYNAITPARTPGVSGKRYHATSQRTNLSDSQDGSPVTAKRAKASSPPPTEESPPLRRTNALSALMDASLHLPATAKPTTATKPSHRGGGHWASGLLDVVRHPEAYTDVIVYQDDDIIMMKDKYPKARHHYLVLPREEIRSLRDLTSAHAPLIRRLAEVARDRVQQLRLEADEQTSGAGPKLHFRMGFHAIPSMPQVHLHLISEDFDSPCLKNKKHWNSFTTDYFLPAKELYRKLLAGDTLSFDKAKYEAMLKTPLRCHRCRLELKTMPKLKEHIKTHTPS
eukprot:m.144245 g.144245  ORF g.144245 m.144245 type:complete len:578 (+) comp16189_c0_seq3:2044-3777(+)